MSDMLLMTSIVFSGRVWVLRVPVVAEVTETCYGIRMQCESLHIDITARGRSLAYKEFQAVFSLAFELFYAADDESLSPDELEIKRYLHTVIESVEDAAADKRE